MSNPLIHTTPEREGGSGGEREMTEGR